MRLPKFTIRRMMIAVAVMGIAFTIARSLLPESPLVISHRQMSSRHKQKAKLWEYYATLSKEGVTKLQWGTLNGGLVGDFMSFNHFVSRPRPIDPAEALAFDAECAHNEAKCLALHDYHIRLAKKWEDAARHRTLVVAPDPAPPLNIEPSGNQDMAF